jgi:hypothetical protein
MRITKCHIPAPGLFMCNLVRASIQSCEVVVLLSLFGDQIMGAEKKPNSTLARTSLNLGFEARDSSSRPKAS